jgi:hypothetical protein
MFNVTHSDRSPTMTSIKDKSAAAAIKDLLSQLMASGLSLIGMPTLWQSALCSLVELHLVRLRKWH